MSATVTVRIPEALREFTEGKHELTVEAGSIADVMAGLKADGYPSLIRHVCNHEGQLRPFVNVYLGERDIRTLEGFRTRLAQGDVVTILPSVAGG
ncbi:MAG TPA: MoaD/ThiS family protein [Gammaproteobacteria bacterium]|nr:MoaD/ThiS family protein [Gammaproteobacteria bacterium]